MLHLLLDMQLKMNVTTSSSATQQQQPQSSSSSKPFLLDRTIAEDTMKFIRGDTSGYQILSYYNPSTGGSLIPFHKFTMGSNVILKHPMIQLETAYGSLRIPLGTQMKISRYNALYLPHGIVFLDSGYVSSTLLYTLETYDLNDDDAKESES